MSSKPVAARVGTILRTRVCGTANARLPMKHSAYSTPRGKASRHRLSRRLRWTWRRAFPRVRCRIACCVHPSGTMFAMRRLFHHCQQQRRRLVGNEHVAAIEYHAQDLERVGRTREAPPRREVGRAASLSRKVKVFSWIGGLALLLLAVPGYCDILIKRFPASRT